MLRHCAMFRWNEGTTAEQVRALEEGLAKLPGEIPEIKAYAFGADLGLRDGNWDFAVVADFDDADAFTTYVEHPAHQQLITDLIEPIRGERTSVQFEA